MPTNNFLLFDQNKANMIADEAYSSNSQRINGVQQGVASSQLQNKTLYQTTLVAYAIAQLMNANGQNASDADAVSTFVSNLSSSFVQKVLDKASSAEAEAGANNTKWMSPALTKAAIDVLVFANDNLLSNATRTLYGLASSANPNDVFAWLGKYNTYCWERQSVAYTEVKNNVSANISIAEDGGRIIKYSSSITLNQHGDIILANPSTLAVTISTSGTLAAAQALAAAAPCYITSTQQLGNVYYIPSGATYGTSGAVTMLYSSSKLRLNYTSSLSIISKIVTVSNVDIGNKEYVFSSNRNAYIDEGTSEGYIYNYFGTPFVEMSGTPKIAVGKYTGTGTSGPSNPNSLTFNFSPKFILFKKQDTTDTNTWIYGVTIFRNNFAASSYRNIVISSGRTFSWYTEVADYGPSAQMNESGVVYYYFAIG